MCFCSEQPGAKYTPLERSDIIWTSANTSGERHAERDRNAPEDVFLAQPAGVSPSFCLSHFISLLRRALALCRNIAI